MIYNFGEIDNSSRPNEQSFILRFKHKEFHNTFVTFEIAGDDIKFVVNAAKGRIVKVDSTGFSKEDASTGKVLVTVQNQGELTADFNILLKKCLGRDNLPGKKITINPGKTEVVVFPFMGGNKGKVTVKCTGKLCPLSFSVNYYCFFLLVLLLDAGFSILGTADINFDIAAPCFCFGICGCVVSKNCTCWKLQNGWSGEKKLFHRCKLTYSLL